MQVKRIFDYLIRSFILTYMLLLLYLIPMGELATEPLSIFYLATIAFYYFIILIIIFLLLFIFLFSHYTRYVYLLFKTMFDFAIVMDFLIFRNYKFHIDSLFLDMLFHDMAGLGISSFAYFVSIAIFIFLLSVNLYLFRISTRLKSGYALWVIVGVGLLIINQIVHMWGSYFHQGYITRYTPYFPYYYPATAVGSVERMSQRYPYIKPKHIGVASDRLDIPKNTGLFHYPQTPIEISTDAPKPNIMMIVLESWQASTLEPSIMPNIYKFAQHNNNYTEHYSTGSVTTRGLFGLMYGLYPTDNFKAVVSDPLKYQTLLTQTVDRLGYAIGAYTSSNLNRFSFKDMFFGDSNDSDIHIFMDTKPHKDDQKAVNMLLSDIDSEDKPWFKWLFLTSSHHSYSYPKNFEKFTPISTSTEAYLLDNSIDATPLYNRYKNSLLYEDSLVSKVLDKIKDKLDNTIVVITGDHAEEFNENRVGQWGHGSNFTKYQTQVPLIIHLPHKQRSVIDSRTSHIDIVPTILSYIGVTNRVSDYSNGHDLNTLQHSKRDIIMASYKDKAYMVDDSILSVGLFVQRYALDSYSSSDISIDRSRLRILQQKEMSFFY